MKRTISLVLVLALGLATKVAKADFTFGEPTNLGPIVNSVYGDYDTCLSAEGLVLFFSSNRSGGYGSDDLYVAMRPSIEDPWGEPVNLGPTVNSSYIEADPGVSTDGLSLLFSSNRPGGYGSWDIWVTKRTTTYDDWGEPVNLGPAVNSPQLDENPSPLTDGVSLLFSSNRSGGHGNYDIWITTQQITGRQMTELVWGTPINLGPSVNTNYYDLSPSISLDGLTLFFCRGASYFGTDIWMTRRNTEDDTWGEPVGLGPTVNSLALDGDPEISADGLWLFFNSSRPNGYGAEDIWRAPIIPVVDFNGDGTVDAADMCIMVDHWGENYALCDIGPMPWGDGIVDVQDLIVLAEHLFEGIPPVELEEVNVDEKDADSQVELEQGQILVVTLESNPTTGYSWEQGESQESILEQMGEAEFKQSETGGPPLVGAGGWEIFRFKAISAGQMTLQLVYHRPWEEGVEPLNTFTLQVVVR